MEPVAKPVRLVPCPCGEDAVWYRAAARPEDAPEGAVCFLTDADFADNYCDECFPLAVPTGERRFWTRITEDATSVKEKPRS